MAHVDQVDLHLLPPVVYVEGVCSSRLVIFSVKCVAGGITEEVGCAILAEAVIVPRDSVNPLVG
jgi:hypothetical protein